MPNNANIRVQAAPQRAQVSVSPEGGVIVNASTAVSQNLKVMVTVGAGSGIDPSDGFTLDDGANIGTGTSTGSKISLSAAQKLGFFGATPIIRPSNFIVSGGSVSPGSDTIALDELNQILLNAQDDIGRIVTRLIDLGLMAPNP